MDFKSTKGIYLQIVDNLCRKIGKYQLKLEETDIDIELLFNIIINKVT